ncbi:hypothetical protein [Streptococcus suis]|uniref:hypothetical protein n=1 Tax=Streptococcus suis TaxID=1307 RepID=UPI000CF72278|nr:hypothetical protein [Streptococcus suis]
MGYKNYKKYRRDDDIESILLVLVLGLLKGLGRVLLPILGALFNRDNINRFLHGDKINRLQTLQLSIRSGFEKHQQLLAENGEDKAVLSLRSRILGELFELDQLYQKNGKYLDAYQSKEIVDTLQLKYQLKIPEKTSTFTGSVDEDEVVDSVEAYQDETWDEQKRISELASEILETYCNIQRDNQVILEKLENAADKREELTAIHEANMSRFRDILQGYLKIKESPKDYFNAEERLAQAKLALETFDRDLDDTIKQFNEADMQDFEISLRMMKKKEG